MNKELIIFSAQYLPFIIAAIAICFLFTLASEKRKEIIKFFLFSAVIALLFEKVLNYFIYTPRPFVSEGVTPLFSHAANNGFPSEHTLFAMVIATVVFVYSKKLGLLLMLLALLVGITRVLAKVHHPVDIAGSIAIAVVSVFLVLISRRWARN